MARRRGRRRLASLVTLVVAVLATMCAGARGGKNVRPRSRAGGFAGGAARARPGRATRAQPPHGGFGAKRGRAAPRTAAEIELESRRRLLVTQTDADADRARAEALREKRREHFGNDQTSRRRRRLTEDSEAYAPIDADDKFERWNTIEEAPASAVCDGCKLTVRGVHADATASARTMPQSSWKALDESLREELLELVWRERTCARFKNVTALRRDTRGRLVDVREDTRHSEITNPTEARRRPEENPDVYAAEMLSGVCELLREDTQTKDLLAGALAALNDVRPMTDARARVICDKISDDAECAASERDEL